MGRAPGGAHARRRGRGDRVGAGDARHARPDLVRRRLPRPGDVPPRPGRRRCSRSSPPMTRRSPSSTRPHRACRARATRWPAGSSGCRAGARRRRAGCHERRDRGARAARQGVPRPRRPRPRRGADVPRLPPGVPQLRGPDRRSADRRGRPARRRARAMLAGGAAPKLLYTIPDHQNPAGVTPRRRAARASGGARAAARLPDRRGRRLPGARLRRAGGAEPLEPGAGRGRADRDDVEDVLPGRPARLGGRAGGGLRRARRGEADDRPVRGRARPAAVRGVRAARLDRRAARALARALPPQVRADARRARARDARRARTGRRPRAGSSRG